MKRRKLSNNANVTEGGDRKLDQRRNYVVDHPKVSKVARGARVRARKGFDAKPDVLKSIAAGATVTDAAIAARVSRKSVYEWLGSDPGFKSAFADACSASVDLLEGEARRRAVEGTLRKRFTKNGVAIIDPATGEQYVEREYSDSLLTFLLKGRRPEVFGDKTHITTDPTPTGPTVLMCTAPPPRPENVGKNAGE